MIITKMTPFWERCHLAGFSTKNRTLKPSPDCSGYAIAEKLLQRWQNGI